jgi:hypothetical protein
MNKNIINLNTENLQRIQEILERFPYNTNFRLISESGSGIGSCLYLELETKVEGIPGVFTAEISGVEDW